MTKITHKRKDVVQDGAYLPDECYIVTAKFKKQGHEVKAFLERLKNAEMKWVEVNRQRYMP